jgi:hypothetical protein
MKQVDSMPTEGQFVIVFEYAGSVWSSILVWSEGVLYERIDESEEEVEQDFYYTVPYYFLSAEHSNQKYFIFGE